MGKMMRLNLPRSKVTAPILLLEVFRVVKSLYEQELTVLLIEQNGLHALEISDRGLRVGKRPGVLEGKEEDLPGDDCVRKCYLELCFLDCGQSRPSRFLSTAQEVDCKKGGVTEEMVPPMQYAVSTGVSEVFA